jgi:3-phenylpropionate/trans-cinnamate dioxygenase ferredoxin component
MDGICSHSQALFSDGKIEGTVVTCPKHRAKFDVCSGCVVKNVNPMLRIATGKQATDLKTYRVTIVDGNIVIDQEKIPL